MKKKYKAPLAEVLELEIDETICNDVGMSGNGSVDNNNTVGDFIPKQ